MFLLPSNGATIAYQTFGHADKPTLVFSNSLGTNFKMWQPQIEALQDAYHIVCYDTRGHGASSAPSGPYDVAMLGQDVLNLLQHLHIEKAMFCGISMGGLTGLWLAIHQPQQFSHIVVANTAAKIGQEQAWRERAALVRAQGLQTIADTAASRWFTGKFVSEHSEAVDTLTHALAQGSVEGYAACCEALAVADVRTDLVKISVPLLVIAGHEDPVTTVLDAQDTVAAVAKSQLAVLPASHISNIEAASEFNALLRQFLV